MISKIGSLQPINVKILENESPDAKLRLSGRIDNWIAQNHSTLKEWPNPTPSWDTFPLQGNEERLWEEDSELNDRFEKNSSTETLAFYWPFHYYHKFQDVPRWGIYIYAGATKLVAQQLLGFSGTNLPISEEHLKNVSLDMLLHHEKYHHAIEVALTPLYNTQEAAGLLDAKTYYDYDKYKKTQNEQHSEERLCNSHVANQKFPTPYLSGVNSVAPVSFDVNSLVQSFMRKQPKGYRDFTAQTISLKDASSSLLDCLKIHQDQILIKGMANAMKSAINNKKIPTYIIL